MKHTFQLHFQFLFYRSHTLKMQVLNNERLRKTLGPNIIKQTGNLGYYHVFRGV
jgi:hypothetical protein